MGDKRDTRSYGHQGLCHSDDSELPSADDWVAYRGLCYLVTILLRALKSPLFLLISVYVYPTTLWKAFDQGLSVGLVFIDTS